MRREIAVDIREVQPAAYRCSDRHLLTVPADAALDMREGFEVLLYCPVCKTTTWADKSGVIEHVPRRMTNRWSETFY